MRFSTRQRGVVRLLCAAAVATMVAGAAVTWAEEIDGVQPAAIDQPRINLVLRRQRNAPALSAKVGAASVSNVEAFLDTGASGVLLSDNTAQKLGVIRERAGNLGAEARFDDVGVGGSSAFAISEPLLVSLAPSTTDVELGPGDKIDDIYDHTAGPLRAQIGPLGGGISDMLTRQLVGDLDVAGTPVMQGMIVIMDPAKANKIEDKIHTTMLDARSPRTVVPRTTRHIRLSYGSFEPYTKTTAGADEPMMAGNPFIGPSPTRSAADATPPVIVVENGRRSSGSWLLDTGAATSMISQKQAAALGVVYAPGTYGTDSPKLIGVPADRQFTMTVGGIGGSSKSVGFYLDRLTLRTVEGHPLTFLHAPVLVADITVTNTRTGEHLTLDGVFGMNYLVASAKLDDSGPLPDINAITPGVFRLIVFDQPRGLLGLD